MHKNHHHSWQVTTSAENQELHKRVFTSKKGAKAAVTEAYEWDGMGWPSTEAVGKIYDLSQSHAHPVALILTIVEVFSTRERGNRATLSVFYQAV